MNDAAMAERQQQRIDLVREKLTDALNASRVEIKDVTHRHRRHAEAQDGRAHFDVVVVSDRFEGQTTLRRHRLVFDALDDLMRTDIHALSIKALTPGQDGSE